MNPALTLGFSMAVGMGIFAGLGWWLDRRRGGGVVWTLIGVGVGLLYIAYETWKVVREVNNEEVRGQKKKAGF
ncbi:MAG: AtpZ/AtpI family protein [bacterium]